MPNYSNIPNDGLWDELKKHEGETFTTTGRGSRPGISFTYTIHGGEMFVSTKTRSISKATVYRAYENAIFLQEKDGFVKGPKALGIPGAGSYLFPIFIKLEIITPTPLTLFTMAGTIEMENKAEEMEAMPRPKGSHNKPKTEIIDTVESIDERIAQVEAAIETLTNDLKVKKAELKDLLKLKEHAEHVAAEKKAEEDKEAILAAVAASGKTVDEILELLR